MFKHMPFSGFSSLMTSAVIVSALGYFVDVFDLLMFSIVRVKSLQDLGLSGDALTQAGLRLMNMQMIGMIVGGVAWGIFGDKKGRLKVLFGSIILYSVGNLANAFVHSVDSYAFWRFVTGVGLAGEIGAGITLVSESIVKEKRGLATTFVATVGVSGAIAAALVADFLHWRTAYIIGGVMGLALLVLRAAVYESQLFEKMDLTNISKGNFFALFRDVHRFIHYLCCIVMGIPVWFYAGILMTLSPELLKGLGVTEAVNVSYIVLISYIGITLGDFASGVLSQLLQSRRRAMFIMLTGGALSILAYFTWPSLSLNGFYFLYAVMGFFFGLWVLIVTMAAELFGTNLRATSASTVPNFIRGALVILNLAVAQFRNAGVDIVTASQIIGGVVLALAFISVYLLPETFHRDMDFVEKL